MATSDRPKRLAAMFIVIQVQTTASAEAEIVEPPRAGERPGKDRPRHADAAAGHALPGQRHLRDDGRKAERRHGEIERPQPQRGQADDDAEDRAEHSGDRQREIGRQLGHGRAGREHAGDVGPERQQRHPADGDLPGKPDHQVEARDEHPVDAGACADDAEVGVAEQRQGPAGNRPAPGPASRLRAWRGHLPVAIEAGDVAVSFIRAVRWRRRRAPRAAPAGR